MTNTLLSLLILSITVVVTISTQNTITTTSLIISSDDRLNKTNHQTTICPCSFRYRKARRNKLIKFQKIITAATTTDLTERTAKLAPAPPNTIVTINKYQDAYSKVQETNTTATATATATVNATKATVANSTKHTVVTDVTASSMMSRDYHIMEQRINKINIPPLLKKPEFNNNTFTIAEKSTLDSAHGKKVDPPATMQESSTTAKISVKATETIKIKTNCAKNKNNVIAYSMTLLDVQQSNKTILLDRKVTHTAQENVIATDGYVATTPTTTQSELLQLTQQQQQQQQHVVHRNIDTTTDDDLSSHEQQYEQRHEQIPDLPISGELEEDGNGSNPCSTCINASSQRMTMADDATVVPYVTHFFLLFCIFNINNLYQE